MSNLLNRGLRNIDSRWRFVSAHWSVSERSGQVCRIVAHDSRYPYIVAFDDGHTVNAVERELIDLDAPIPEVSNG
jgi:hypothetical protein